jgi:hypothetical protein
MRLRNIGAVNDMAQIRRREVLETRSAFAPASSIASAVTVVVIPFDMVGKICPSHPRSHILEMPRRSALECSPRQRARLTNAAPLPVSIEYLIEALPIRMRRAKQRPQCRLQR